MSGVLILVLCVLLAVGVEQGLEELLPRARARRWR
jgi:hypothetical protein